MIDEQSQGPESNKPQPPSGLRSAVDNVSRVRQAARALKAIRQAVAVARLGALWPLIVGSITVLLVVIALILILLLIYAVSGGFLKSTSIPGDGQNPIDNCHATSTKGDSIVGQGGRDCRNTTVNSPSAIPTSQLPTTELAKQVAAHPNISWSCRSTSDARVDVRSGQVDPALLQLLLSAAEANFRFTACPLKTGHKTCVGRPRVFGPPPTPHGCPTGQGGSNPISRHYLGKGVDIPLVDSQPVNRSNAKANDLVRFWRNQLSAQYELLGPSAPPAFRNDSDHNDHIHLGTPK